MQEVNWTAFVILVVLFGLVTMLGFAAAHWRKGDLSLLHEWGLGGRRFGTFMTWFLVGGDLYTAYTFVAVPALAFGAGAQAFFAVPYQIMVFPILFLVFSRLWHVSHKRGYVTAADFVGGRFGNRWLVLAVAVTGIVATMPYIALQLVGLQVVIGAVGISGRGILNDLPLIIAFVILAAFTYSSGLRAPAAIAVIKDILIYTTAIVAIIVIPIKLGGFGHIFAAVPAEKLILAAPGPHTTGSYGSYATLAFGSALALLLYPHSVTGILSASSSHSIRRNAALLPAYGIMLAVLALLGFMAIAAGVDKMPQYAQGFAHFSNNFAIPALLMNMFPSWFVGIAFAAIGIGALVPAAIMSIAAANLFTRNIYRPFFHANASDQQEAKMAKWVSLVVKFGALIFVLGLPTQYAIQLQLLGGIWIIQTLPAVVFGLYTNRLNGWALLIGWALGMGFGTWMAASVGFGSTYTITIGSWSFPCYIAVSTLVLNMIVAFGLSYIFEAMGATPNDQTVPADYEIS